MYHTFPLNSHAVLHLHTTYGCATSCSYLYHSNIYENNVLLLEPCKIFSGDYTYKYCKSNSHDFRQTEKKNKKQSNDEGQHLCLRGHTERATTTNKSQSDKRMCALPLSQSHQSKFL